MAIQRLGTKFFEGANIPEKVTKAKINEIIDEVNDLIDGTIDGTNLNLSGTLTVDTITEYTLNNGITIESVTIKDGGATFSTVNSYATANSITAFAGGGQASATQLSVEQNLITTCATAGDSVKLPSAVKGNRITIKNIGATAADIFPSTGDSIDALAVNLAIRIQPKSTVIFFAKDNTVWESNIDQSFTLIAPTTNKGQLELKATDSAGNTVTTVTNASQAAARTYTIPDAGTNADFVMNAGAQSIAGVKTFSSQTVHSAGIVSAPGLVVGANDNGQYEISATQQGFSIANTLVGGYDSNGLFTNAINEQTAGTGVTVDSVLCKDGGVSNSLATIFAGFFPASAQNNITAGTGGAIAITNYLTTINSDAGGDAFTLANATQIGQIKKILMVADGGGDCVITPTSLSGGTTITMNDANDYVILIWNGTAWVALENFGCTIA